GEYDRFPNSPTVYIGRKRGSVLVHGHLRIDRVKCRRENFQRRLKLYSTYPVKGHRLWSKDSYFANEAGKVLGRSRRLQRARARGRDRRSSSILAPSIRPDLRERQSGGRHLLRRSNTGTYATAKLRPHSPQPCQTYSRPRRSDRGS